MEYNYTPELTQPAKLYTSIPLFEEGFQIKHMVVGGGLFITVIIPLIIALIFDIVWIKQLFIHTWIVILVVSFLLVWVITSLEWDKKNFFFYAKDRLLFVNRRTKRYEHGHRVLMINRVTYRPVQRRR